MSKFRTELISFFVILAVVVTVTPADVLGCDEDVCSNGGTYIPESTESDRNYTCVCPNTHYGTECQFENVCLAYPKIWCVNGTCTKINGSNYECECTDGYVGHRCSNYNPCVSNPCRADQECEYIMHGHHRCKCNVPGFYGARCNLYNNCTSKPCNTGKCKHLGNRKFVCDCDTDNTGYYGELCELYNPCYKGPCLNDGNCTYSGEGETVECSCPKGFGGAFCQFIDLCDRDRPCLNEGICTPLIKEPPEYKCHCQRGYLGENCEIAVRCEEDMTVDIRGFIQWPELLVNRDIDMRCQFGGTAHRKCVQDEWKPQRPRWNYPDTSQCKSVNITRDLAKEFTAYLKDITRNAFDMIAEELESSTELLVAVAKYTYDDYDFAQDVMACISNLLCVNKSVMRSSSNHHGTNIQLLQLLDRYKEMAEISEDENSLSLIHEHLNIWIQKTGFQDLKRGIEYTSNNASIYVPGEALGIPDPESRTRVGFISMLKDTLFVEDGNSTQNETDFPFKNYKECHDEVSSDREVTSADVCDNVVTNLNNPVIIGFRIPKVECPFTCAFWNESVRNWQTGGITRASQNDTHVTCESDHLTYFSIILDPHYSKDPSAKHQKILSIISYVGCGITIVSLIITIFTYVVFKLLRTLSGKILIHLCMALLGINLIFIVDTIPAVVEIINICRSMAMALHYFTLSTFLWMGMEAVHMHQTLIKVFRSGGTKSFMMKCIIVSWGVPVIPVAVVAGIDLKYYAPVNGLCMLSQSNHLVYYLSYMMPCILILTANFIIFFMILRAVCTCGRKHTLHTTTGIRRTQVGCAISITFLLGLTWVFSLLKIGNASLAFHYIFTTVNSLLGFFIFLFRCALNPEAIRAWRVSCCSDCTRDSQRTRMTVSGVRNNTLQEERKVIKDSGNFSDEHAHTNPNFIENSCAKNSFAGNCSNTVLLSVVSHSNKHFTVEDDDDMKPNNLKPKNGFDREENNYEYII